MKAVFQYTREQIQSIFRSYSNRNLAVISGNSENEFPFHEDMDNPTDTFNSITNSSLEVEKGSLFVPLIAERDGHDFISDAIRKGASGFLYNRDHKIMASLPEEVRRLGIGVEDTWRALAILANFHRKRFYPHIIAITGSSGKTTTKEFFRSCLSSLPASSIVVTEKNYNNEIGLPFTLFRIDSNTRIVVLEMGMNHRGEIERLSRIAEPHTMVITTIGSAHIENLGSPEAIAWEKSDIVKGSRKLDTTPLGRNYTPKLYVPEDVAYKDIIEKNAMNQSVEVVYWQLPRMEEDAQFRIMHKDNKGYNLNIQGNKLVWNLPGDKILSNLAGVFQVLIDLEFDISLLVSGIHYYRPEGNRLKIESTDRYRVINDTYNANPESMESSISITKQLSDGKDFLCILGDMKELGDYSEYYHKKIGNFLANLGCKMLITYGKDSRFILEEFLNEKNDSEERRGIHFPEGELDGAVTWIVNNAPKNCTILCKGSRSMKMETIVEKILAMPPII